MKKRTQTVKLVLMAAVISAAVTLSNVRGTEPDEENPHLWKPTVKSVAVFKNGLGFFIRQGEVNLREG